jgi:CRISPR system Cascade subunit CasD
MNANTLFLRLEGPMQSWGNQESKFVIRRTSEAPTKSGVIGLLCAALGVCRSDAPNKWLPKLNALHMGVRIDMPGVRWWDYHTVGAGMQMRIAEGEGKTKVGAMLTRREYLCDASFLVSLQGEPRLISELTAAMHSPKWALYLGRKSCPPSRPVQEEPPATFRDLISSLSIPWRRRFNRKEDDPSTVDCLLDWIPTDQQPDAPDDANVWFDVPVAFDPPAHVPRFVIRKQLRVGTNGEIDVAAIPAQNLTPRPSRPRANYQNTEYRKRRSQRLQSDHGLCVFCKGPATTVQHITYRRAGGDEAQEDLRSLCRLCHDACTMIEYGMGMGLDRINPEDVHWREAISNKRDEIIKFRSVAARKRKLHPEEVE